jgi:xylulose-5-phosphate/fructose-6-phosphate phosphoketolase
MKIKGESKLKVKISKMHQLSKPSSQRLANIHAYWQATNYLSAVMLYLKENALLQKSLKPEHIKPRLFGHWGTVPGLNFIYAHLNRLIQDTNANLMLIVGPGHGSPSNLANLYIEGTLGEYYPEFRQTLAGFTNLVRSFSWAGGLPSHNTPITPGTIHEGGELGYCLSHAFGAAFDNPDLIVTCVVGDGEAETGPLATSWHSNKFLNPVTDGAVLPILHLNGYKISGPTIFGRMCDDDLKSLFNGYGYQVRFVEGENPVAVHPVMWQTLNWAYSEICRIQNQVRSKKLTDSPSWPMIILRTPKGWTCPKTLDGLPLEGSFRCHQIPIKDPAINPKHFKVLEKWITGYKSKELFDASARPKSKITSVCPKDNKRMGTNPHANGGNLLVPLKLPDYKNYAIKVSRPGPVKAEGTKELGKYLRDVFKNNASNHNFRLFCPDETDSNRLSHVFEATKRNFMWPLLKTDENLAQNGRVMEVLSEHQCQGWLEGYLLTGRHGLFASYEAFATIIDSMVNQYAKWLKVSREVPWRKPIASLNYLLTSHAWRQDHNGYSHQGPGFINTLLTKKKSVVRIYLPPDTNCLLHIMDHCLKTYDYVNLIITTKQPMPQWLNLKAAKEHAEHGISIWQWASNDDGNPDVVLASAGDIPTFEILAAASLLRQEVPELKVRVVNVMDLLTLESHLDHPHGIDDATFIKIFTKNCPVIFGFHGYPRVIHELVHHHHEPTRFHVRGYIEEGTTTTPFDMVARNRLSRYHLAIEALRRVARLHSKVGCIIEKFEQQLVANHKYIQEHDEDMPEIRDWQWKG